VVPIERGDAAAATRALREPSSIESRLAFARRATAVSRPLFWLNSARHVWPDVKATLSGDLQPAAVTLEPGGLLAVQGAFEFGTMRVVREALAAHPTVRTVRLESRGGRVAEGLALGRAQLRDRHAQGGDFLHFLDSGLRPVISSFENRTFHLRCWGHPDCSGEGGSPC